MLLGAVLSTSSPIALSQTAGVPGPMHIVDTGELMQLFIRPAYQELRSAVARPPQSRQDWAAIYRSAVRLAEMENLIFFRESNRYTTQPEFPVLAAKARDTTAEVVRQTLAAMPNARSDDFAPIKKAYEAIASTCTACHRGLGTMNGPTVNP
jgi:hypothetical protein